MQLSTLTRSTVVAVAVLAVLWTVMPIAAIAADPSVDPKCWSLNQQALCSNLQGYFDAADLAAGKSSACGQGWFQCYAGTKPIDIAIKVGGIGQVKNLGEYIRLVYAWLIPVGAILAVVVIMIGGIIWLTSGGADRLSTAKQWIGNAIVGLLLLVFSYVILNTINPDLVRLTLPRTQILRPVIVGAQFCANLEDGIEVHQTSTEGPIARPEDMRCGKKFYPVGTSSRTCLGAVCPARKVCIPGAGENGYACVDGTIGGEVAGDGDAFLDNDIELVALCSDGTRKTILSGNGQEITERRRHKFALTGSSQNLRAVEDACGGSTLNGTAATNTVRGFFFMLEVNDDKGLLDSGKDDWFAVGAKACGQSDPIRQGSQTNPSSITWEHVPQSDLISQMQIYAAMRDQNPTPYTCNMGLSRANFPDR